MHRVIIAGGGITGAFAAYRLSLRGIQVTVIDRRDGLPVASHHNPGGLNPFHGPGIPGLMAEFSLHSYHLHRHDWKRIQELSGIDFTPRLIDRVMLAFSAAEAQPLLENQKLYQAAAGFSAQWLSGRELLRLEPRLSGRVVGGLFTHGNASVNAERYTRAIMKAAEALGAELIEEEVIGFAVVKDAVTVALAGGQSCTGRDLIFATGAWSNLFASPDSARNPLEPIKGELLLAELPGEPLGFDLTRGQYGIYRAGESTYWLGGTRESKDFDFSITAAGAQSIQARVAELVPHAEPLRVLRHGCAMRPATADGLPIVGRLPGHEHVYVATGAGAKGMLWSAGIADVCAELLTDPASDAKYRHLSIERFVGSAARGL